MERVARRFERFFVRADHALSGVLSLLVRSALAYYRQDGPTRARSIAYFAMFSIFPLLLLLIVIGGSMVDPDEATRVITELVERYVPVAAELVQENIEILLRSRATFGLLALVALLWSASGVFMAIFRSVNRMWGNPNSQLFWSEKLFGLAVTFTIGIFLLASILFSAAASVVRSRQPALLDLRLATQLSRGWLSALVAAVVPTIGFIILYRVMPRGRAAWREAWLGGLIAGLLWQAVTQLFGWYLGSVVRSAPIYGSVGAIAVFLLWSYWSAVILLLGAAFTAEYTRWRRAGRRLERRRLREWIAEWPR